MLLLLLSSSWLLVQLGGCTWVDQAEYNDRMDIDGDGIEGLIDCDDNNPDIREPTTWFQDGDEDGYGNPDDVKSACERPNGYIDNNRDCDDTDPALNPADSDSDGASTCDGDCDDDDFSRNLQDVDGDGFTTCDPVADCDDNQGSIHPDATEIPGDAVDQNCDLIDLCFLDVDEDGARHDIDVQASANILCTDIGLSLADAPVDCDDDNPLVAPGLQEFCNFIDDDCDGVVDEDAVDLTDWYYDGDGDGYGTPEDLNQPVATTCNPPSGFVAGPQFDCDDTNDALNYNDDDGDGETSCGGDCDDNNSLLNTLDEDGDFFSTCEGDCDDNDPTIFVGAVDEWYDGVDNNCDGLNDYDQDQDGFIEASIDEAFRGGTAPNGGDCDDLVATTYPGAREWCGDYQLVNLERTYIDSDCDGEHYLPDTVSGLVDGLGTFDLAVYDASDPASISIGLFTLWDGMALDGTDTSSLNPDLRIGEIGVCPRSDGSAWLVSMDLTAAVAAAPVLITGHGAPRLDGSPGGRLFWADSAPGGSGFAVSNLAVGGSIHDGWFFIADAGTEGELPFLYLEGVSFEDPVLWDSLDAPNLVDAYNARVTLNDVTANDIGVTSLVQSFLNCEGCQLNAYLLEISNAYFEEQALHLVNTDTQLDSMNAENLHSKGRGAVAYVHEGSLSVDGKGKGDGPDFSTGPGTNVGIGDASGIVFDPLLPSLGVFSNNISELDGGLFYILDADLTLETPLVDGNEAWGNGGVLFVEGLSTVSVYDTKFLNNTAQDGGVIHTSVDVFVDDCIFDTNLARALGKGGAIYADAAGAVWSTDSLYDKNAADVGGAIALARGSWSARLTGDTFTANVANGGGGAIYAAEALVSLVGSTLNANESALGGAALHLVSAVALDVDSDFIDNGVKSDSPGAVTVDTNSALWLNPAGQWRDNRAVDIGLDRATGFDTFFPVPGTEVLCGLGQGCQVILSVDPV